jgi:hypothetical protein
VSRGSAFERFDPLIKSMKNCGSSYFNYHTLKGEWVPFYAFASEVYEIQLCTMAQNQTWSGVRTGPSETPRIRAWKILSVCSHGTVAIMIVSVTRSLKVQSVMIRPWSTTLTGCTPLSWTLLPAAFIVIVYHWTLTDFEAKPVVETNYILASVQRHR